jgi:AraC family transcriptional regulator of adaptative response / DNA-3-methyladenine glycosylase II
MEELHLSFPGPLCPDNVFGHLVATAVPGVEEWRDGWYRRTLRLGRGGGVVALRPTSDYIDCRLAVDDGRDRDPAIAQCRWMLDLDTDPEPIDEHLGSDPALAPLVASAPGRRVPRSPDPAEFAVRAVLGQQVSTAAARTHASRLVLAYGEAISDPDGGLTHLFPTVAALAGFDPASLAMPESRRRTMRALVEALAGGELELVPATGWASARRSLLALPGFGPWTVETILMRALGDPDAFPGSDLGVVRAARGLGLPSTPLGLARAAEAWRPWRAYAVQHLWATGNHPITFLPAS